MSNTVKKYLTLIVLGLAGGSIYVFPYMKYVFYDPMLNVMHINNQQSGLLLTMYAIGCIILYIPGGIVADKISHKRALIISLFGATVLTVIYALSFNFELSLVIWLLLAFATGFVFWAALIKAIRIIGTEKEQGRLYGVYYAANGVAASVVNFISLQVFSSFSDEKTGLFAAVMVMAAFTGLAGLLLIFLLDDSKKEGVAADTEKKFVFSDVPKVLKNPAVWMVSLIFFFTYALYSCSTYFTPYLTDVVHISVKSSGILSIIRTNVFMLVAPIGGFLADKIFKSTLKWFVCGSGLLAVAIGIIIAIGSNASVVLISVLTLVPGFISMTLYGIMFSIMGECKIPIKYAGTAIGVASIIGYAPDLFLSTIFGGILDTNGNAGYPVIFAVLAAFCLVSIGICIYLLKRSKKLQDQGVEVA